MPPKPTQVTETPNYPIKMDIQPPQVAAQKDTGQTLAKTLITKQTSKVRVHQFVSSLVPVHRSRSCCPRKDPVSPFDMFKEHDQNGHRIFHRAASVYSRKTIKEAMDCFEDHLDELESPQFNLREAVMEMSGMVLSTGQSDQDYLTFQTLKSLMEETPKSHGVTPLWLAMVSKPAGQEDDRRDFVQYLVEKIGVKVNVMHTETFWTPLHWAARHGDFDLMKMMLDKGAKAFTPDVKGRFPIDIAGYFQNKATVKLLVQHSIHQFKQLLVNTQTQSLGKLLEEPKVKPGLFECSDAFLASPYYASVLLYWAVQCEQTEISDLKFILNSMESYPEARLPFEQEQTAIHAAAICDYPEKLDLLCVDLYKRHQIKTKEALAANKNLEVKRKENKLESVLQLHDIVIKQPHLRNLQQMELKFWQNFKFVHSQLLDFDLQDLDGNTPLHLAAQFNNTKSAKTLLENWRCSCDVRNWRGVMSKNMGLWHKETQQLFDDYYYIVDRKLKQNNDSRNWRSRIDIERQNLASLPSAQEEIRLDVRKVEEIKDWQESTVSTMQRIISQKDAEVVLTPGLLSNRTDVPQCPDVVLQMQQKTEEQKRRLNFVLRMLDVNNFLVRIFKGINGHDYFVTLSLSEEQLVKEAIMCGYLVKVQQYSIKVPFTEKLKNKLVPFTSKDIQVLTMKKLQRVFNFQDLIDQKILQSVFSMHDNVELYHVEKSFAASGWRKYIPHIITSAPNFILEKFDGEQQYKDLCSMASYFGESSTLISSFFLFYQIWMLPIVLFAAGISIHQYINKKTLHTCGPLPTSNLEVPLYYSGVCPANITIQTTFANISDIILQPNNDTSSTNITGEQGVGRLLESVNVKTVSVLNQSRNILAVFAVFVAIYATVLIEFWKRKQNHINFVLGKSITEDEETIINPDYLGFKKMSWSKFDVTKSEKQGRRCKSTVAKILLFLVALILLAASVVGYVLVRNRIQNGTIQGIILTVILAVTSALHGFSVDKLLAIANMKYLTDKNRSYIINKMAFEFVNLNLPVLYALVYTNNSDQNISNGFVFDQTYHLIFGIVFSTCISLLGEKLIMFLKYQAFKIYYFILVRMKAKRQMLSHKDVLPDNPEQMKVKKEKEIYAGCFQPQESASDANTNNSTSELLKNDKLKNESAPTKQRRCCCRFTWETTYLRPVVKSGATKLNQYESDFNLFVDAVELNSRMTEFGEKDQVHQTIQKYLIFSLSILYAGICPLATVVCFGYFVLDQIIDRYLICYVCRRETPIIDAPSQLWTQYAELIVVANVISNSLLLYTATDSYMTVFGNWFKVKDQDILWYVLLIEHLVIAIQIGIKFIIPDMPIALRKMLMRHVLELEHFFDIKTGDKSTALEKQKGVEELSAKQKALQIIQHYQKDKSEIGLREGHLADFLQVDPRQHNYQNVMKALEDGLRVNLEIRMYRETFLLAERAILGKKLKKFLKVTKAVMIACVECQNQSATFFCQECGDHYCIECNDFLHKTNSVYQKHTRQNIVQTHANGSTSTQFPPVKGQSAAWIKFEYFNFPLNPQNAALFKQVQTYFEHAKRAYLKLNYINEITGQLDIASMLIDQNYDSLEREMGKNLQQKHSSEYGQRTVLSQKEMVDNENFNDEELFYLNRVAFKLLKKHGAKLRFDKFTKDLETLQSGSYSERINLWLSCINEGEEQLRIRDLTDINSNQDLISRQKMTSVVLASFPQFSGSAPPTAESVVSSLFGRQEVMSICELQQSIKKNGAAHEMVCCILQIDPQEAFGMSTSHSLASLEGN